VDGVFVRQLPVLEMASGNVVKGIETIINSHVFDEGLIFVPGRVNDAVFDAVIKHYWGASQATIEAIRKKFPLSKYKDQKARFKELYQFQTFTCHNRFLTEGFKNKTYNLQYSRGTGIHGSDIAADFYNGAAASSMPSFLAPTAGDPTFGTFAATFQSYLTSHARTGDPNTFRDKNSIQWPLVTPGPVYTNVLHATNQGYELFVDPVTKAEDCDFWRDALAGMTNSLGLAPPGAVVPSTIGGASGNASGNF
jgi:carboxylesterase type B